MSRKGDYGVNLMPVSKGQTTNKPSFDRASAEALAQTKQKAVNEQQTIKK